MEKLVNFVSIFAIVGLCSGASMRSQENIGKD